jgi:hypothetical protein
MQVSKTELQHQVMIEAIENHMPEVIIIDEIGTELESLAARTIAERGVQLVGTAHGNCLESLIKNPTLTDLIGGIQNVTLSDDEARRRGTQKSIMERKSTSGFEIGIEINNRKSWTIHRNIEKSVDNILQNNPLNLQYREIESHLTTTIHYETSNKSILLKPNLENKTIKDKNLKNKVVIPKFKENSILNNVNINNVNSPILIYNISINQTNINEACQKLKIPILQTKDIKKAKIIIVLKSHLIQTKTINEISRIKNIPIIEIKNNTVAQIVETLEPMLESTSNVP